MALGLKEPQESLWKLARSAPAAVVVVEVFVVVAVALGVRLVLWKVTTFLKLLVKLKSFKIFTKLNEINPLDAFSNSSEGSGVVVFA